MQEPQDYLDISNAGPLILGVSRDEIETQNLDGPLSVLNSLLSTPEMAARFKENVEIAFYGYGDDPRELFEIQEVREFVFKLDDAFPYWLFFMMKFGQGLQCIFLCKMLPFLTDEAKREIIPKRLGELLTGRWLPAMNHICNFVGMSEHEVEPLTERAVSYLMEGPFRLGKF